MDKSTIKFVLILAGLVLLAGGGYVAYTKTRGLRNNNPGNIRKNVATTWQGQAPDQSGDDEFVQFISPEWGIRAIAKILNSYASRGVDTIREIISTWAPPNENNTAAYIQSVSNHMNIDPDFKIPADSLLREKLVEAIIKHENGIQPYPSDVIKDGLKLA